MKPWSKSDNAERLDGHNGLLLSPHVDNLFDRGLITFAKTGRVMVSPNLNPEVSIRWKLDFNQPGIHFNKGQVPYLEYHQDLIFQS
jgi:predicted restriction endonuclease